MKYFKILLLVISPISMAQESKKNLVGTVTDNQAQTISQAVIRIHGTKKQTQSAADGTFKFEDLALGRYEIDIEISKSRHYNTSIEHDGSMVVINIDNLQLDDLVVSANPLEHNQLKMTTPVAILSEEDLVMDRGLSLDQTLNQITGVNSGSFGAGAGQIVIRGQQGPRVTVLTNNVTNQDASSVSPDHWVSTEPLLAKQIEVLKGPATLLYGGGAVGGVVNVVDDVIPMQMIDGVEGGLEGRFSDNTLTERAGVISLSGGLTANLMGHFSYFNSSSEDFKIPGSAESAVLHQAEGHDEDDEDEEANLGILENSSVQSDGVNLGFSWVYDRGYWGLSVSNFNRNYGIPGHEHGHEEGGDTDAEEEEFVRIDLDKSIINIKGLHQLSDESFIRQLRTHYSTTDYQHIELEGAEIGTVFDNQADEFRLELTHGTVGGFEGVWGAQYSKRDFSALGEEAYILPSETQILSLFMVEEREFDNWHGEFGFRFDEQSVKTALFNDINDSAFSLSLGATIELNEHWTLPINLASAQRLPTAEEYFSNQGDADQLIPHLATATIEIGNPELGPETANNFDVGLKYRHQGFSFNLAYFYNQIDDYIFLRDTGSTSDDLPVFVYTQQNASFNGYEADVAYQFADRFNNQWDFRLFTDATHAELNNGENVPRIPASRMGAEVNWLRGDWSVGLNHTHVNQQTDLANFELRTEAYDLLDLSVNWVNYGNHFETLVFIKAKNLLDEEIRDHSSFIKDIAPRPGRSLTAGFRLTF
ncbi:TonB-dependent receptor [Marinicella litoralis]|uniref:Iron complex outermembrane receptor protein n=1 Tax=Marinicella litoralis TaxID=644220 RepID=A0A4R6XVS5_9GAMM|nr:TonB-dependent receptor [Marinicella litoralis]TDR22314.1 iron complex outermembrane receptor protein [Marinicella litoralis]